MKSEEEKSCIEMELIADLAALDQLGDHEYDARVLLPDHTPEVNDGRRQAALRRDVELGRQLLKVSLHSTHFGTLLFTYLFCFFFLVYKHLFDCINLHQLCVK